MTQVKDELGQTTWLSVSFADIIREAPKQMTFVVFELIMKFGMQQGGTFRFDAVNLAKVIQGDLTGIPKNARITPKLMETLKPHLRKVFLELPDGRWTLRPEIFSVSDPYLEGGPDSDTPPASQH